ncbi:hypothetical protein GB2207_10416 [marine gamma proteobacterium HTCC2207]|uniref:Uncharacterized protein n=1 Tax=gamma proteobacterium HTCC2207 TaxID=314287 RepID=Q1YU40_9GAMM|nr:hypothetical protein GB2207_10416 [marine gamma proteobacterium HTCC2207] [gamma proteobacterium HTCC2207]
MAGEVGEIASDELEFAGLMIWVRQVKSSLRLFIGCGAITVRGPLRFKRAY